MPSRLIVLEVFLLPELFDEIFQYLSYRELFRMQLVSTEFRDLIHQSKKLRRIMFLEPAVVGNVVPLLIPFRIPRPLGAGLPRRFDTIWAKVSDVTEAVRNSQTVCGSSEKLSSDILLHVGKNLEVDPPALNPTLDYWCVNRKLDTILLKEPSVLHTEMGLRLVPKSCKQMIENDSRRRMLVTQPPVADVVVGRSGSKYGIYEAHNIRGVTIGDILDAEAKRNERRNSIPINRLMRDG